MQALPYEHAIGSILKRDKRFHPQAYIFLKEALDFTVQRIMDANKSQQRHVTGQELLEGFRDLALREFGPMAATLFREWGLTQCQDVGDMVFHLIEEQVFGKQDSDTKDDFSAIYSFEEAFARPFEPRQRAPMVHA